MGGEFYEALWNMVFIFYFVDNVALDEFTLPI